MDPEVANDLFVEVFDDVPVELEQCSFECWDGFFIPVRGGLTGFVSIM